MNVDTVPATPLRLSMLLVAGFAAAWAILEIALGSSLQQHYDLKQVVWCRYASHLLLVALILAWRPQDAPWRSRRPWLQLARSSLMLVMPIAFVAGLARGTPAPLVWAEFWCAPLLILAFARLLLRERAPWLLWVAAFVVMLAAVVVHVPTIPQTRGDVVFPLVMAGSFGLYVVATRALRNEPLWTNLFFTALVPFVALSPWMPGVWVMPTLHDLIVLVSIGGVGLVSLAMLDRAVEASSASFVAALLGLQLPFDVLLSHLYRSEPIERHDMVVTLVLGALCAVLWRHAARLQPAVRSGRLGSARASFEASS